MIRPSQMTIGEYINYTHHMAIRASGKVSNVKFFSATHDQAVENKPKDYFLINYDIPKIGLGGYIIFDYQWLRHQGLNQNDILHSILGDISRYLHKYLTGD